MSSLPPDIDLGDVTADWPAELMDTLASASLQELLDTVLTAGGCDLEDTSTLQDQDQAQISAIEQQLQLVERSIIATTPSPGPTAAAAAIGGLAPPQSAVSGGGVIRSGALGSNSNMGGVGAQPQQHQQQHHRILQQRVSLPGTVNSVQYRTFIITKQCCGSGSGIRCFFTPRIRDPDPGSGMEQWSDPGSGISKQNL
jgi:hypothetical protein